jgi:transcriptional regulator with XRE-family HTH domain
VVKQNDKPTTLGEFINEYAQLHNMSLRDLAAKCKVSHTGLSRMANWNSPEGDYDVRLTILEKIAKGMNVDICTLVALVRPKATRRDLAIDLLALRMADLPAEDQQVLRDMADGMIARRSRTQN